MSLRNAALVLISGTLLGVVLTLLAGSEPGFLLSFFIIAGSLAATLGVQRSAVYVFFPLPALAFFAAGVLTGAVHDSSLTSSTAGLSAGFLQWIAGIFIPAIVATILVLLVGAGRWLLAHQLVTGHFTMPGRPAVARSARSAPSARRFDTDGWAVPGPADGQGQRPDRDAPPGRRPGKAPWLDDDGGTARPAPRGNRASWGDSRRPGSNPRPPAESRDARPSPNQSTDRPARPSPRDPGPQRQPRTSRDPWD